MPAVNRTYRAAGAVGTGPGRQIGVAPVVPNVAQRAASGWTPTVANLLVLVVVELAAFAAIRYLFKRIG